MPGRQYDQPANSIRSFGSVAANGFHLPQDLVLYPRTQPLEPRYVAGRSISIVDGFDSGEGEGEFTVESDTYDGSNSQEITLASAADGYRYGFNGKENDNEVKGTGNQQDYGMRIYDPRLGRFLSVDPLTKKFAYLTPYQFASNRPINSIDLDGLEAVDANSNKTDEDVSSRNVDADGNVFRVYDKGNSTGIDRSKTLSRIELSIKYPRLDFVEPAIIGKGNLYHTGVPENTDNANDIFSFGVASRDNAGGNLADVSINGAGNTFRHLLLSTVLTSAYGTTKSKEITDSYEASEMNKSGLSLDNEVDLLNNMYGRQYAITNKIDIRTVIQSTEATANFLNNLAVYTLSNIDEYKNNPAFSGIISGQEKLFNKEQYGVSFFIENMKKAMDTKPVSPPPVVF